MAMANLRSGWQPADYKAGHSLQDFWVIKEQVSKVMLQDYWFNMSMKLLKG